jgi:hypothetical protein
VERSASIFRVDRKTKEVARCTSTRLQGVTFQEMVIFILTAPEKLKIQ